MPVLYGKGTLMQAKYYSVQLIFIIGQFVLWSAYDLYNGTYGLRSLGLIQVSCM
jgi:ABC-type Zn2+ transport system substrate-binding protein/surface adhesin